MSVSKSMLKNTLLVINVIFLFFGTFAIIGSIFQVFSSNSMILTLMQKALIYLQLVYSFVFFTCAFFGYSAAKNEKLITLKVYTGLIAMCILFQVAFIAIAATSGTEMSQDAIKTNFIGDFKNQNPLIQKLVQTVQQKNKCCGVDSPSDYPSLSELPDSCCGAFASNEKATGICNQGDIYSNGCGTLFLDALLELVSFDTSNAMTLFNYITFAIEFLAAAFALILIKQIKENSFV